VIYDKEGNLTDKRAIKTSRLIEEECEKLFKALFKQGMPVAEGRALLSDLEGSIRVAVQLCILKSRCK
jgi:hypothetical protein